LFLAIDANFRLMRKDVSSEAKDPGLVKGWGFFGEVTKYMTHLEKHWDQKQEVSGGGTMTWRPNRSLTQFFSSTEVLASPTTPLTNRCASSWGRHHRESGQSTAPATT
jgi:hypothetical protein